MVCVRVCAYLVRSSKYEDLVAWCVCVLGLMWAVVEDHDNLFIMAEIIHFIGIGLLAYKLTSKKNAGGAPL